MPLFITQNNIYLTKCQPIFVLFCLILFYFVITNIVIVVPKIYEQPGSLLGYLAALVSHIYIKAFLPAPTAPSPP